MWKHNIRLAFRNLWRHKTFSIINMPGLTIGLASCIFIGLYAFSELSFDHFNRNHNMVYRINKLTNEKDKQGRRDALTPGQLAPVLKKEVPGVIAAARFRPWFSEMPVSSDSMKLTLKDVSWAVGSGQWAVGSGQWAVGSGEWGVGSGEWMFILQDIIKIIPNN